MTAVMTREVADVATPVCSLEALVEQRGVCALVGDRHVAVFRLGGNEVVAVDNVDPFTGASVLSRGLVGSTAVEGDAVVYVASPLRKQRFDLRTGRCLDDDAVVLERFETEVLEDGVVVIRDGGGPTGGRRPGMGSRWGARPAAAA